ncbi:hypothetical protein [Ferruginibacter albus]|uniref:hypothetical protein n=1 Tax=Ferruginibacter albus TaxID=2875540 RepID=UPI001CC60A38|nr:hypothetical protein [Ferruginibacter albus]UAY51139.1 hypothetical protein K9M53_11120 [Ferruginibacter albus]
MSSSIKSQVILIKNHVYVEEKQADSINIKLDSILILSVGPSTTRIVLNDLNDYLSKKLSKKKIFTSYAYLGRNITDAKKEFKLLNTDGYKAILLFLPKDSAFFEVTHSYSNRDREPVVWTRTENLYYEQAFDFRFYKAGQNPEKFWNALVEIDGDPSDNFATKKIGNKLISLFTKHKYIQ